MARKDLGSSIKDLKMVSPFVIAVQTVIVQMSIQSKIVQKSFQSKIVQTAIVQMAIVQMSLQSEHPCSLKQSKRRQSKRHRQSKWRQSNHEQSIRVQSIRVQSKQGWTTNHTQILLHNALLAQQKMFSSFTKNCTEIVKLNYSELTVSISHSMIFILQMTKLRRIFI